MRMASGFWLVVVAALAVCSGQAWAEEASPDQDEAIAYVPMEVPPPPARPQRKLQFEEQVGKVSDQFGSRVTAEAMFQLERDIYHEGELRFLLPRTSGWQDLLARQRDLLGDVTTRNSNSVIRFSRIEPFDANLPIYGVYAVSAEQARKTIVVVLTCLDDRVVEEWQQLKTRQVKLLKELAASREAVPRLRSEVEELTGKGKDLARLLQGIPALPPADETRATIIKCNDLAKTIDVEVAGLQARIRAIQSVLTKGVSTPEPSNTLHQQMVNLDIDLAGALARKEAVEKPLKQAEDLYAMQMRLAEAERELNKMTKQQEYALRDLKRIDGTLENSPESMRFVTVVDDRIVIVRRPEKPAETRPATQPS